MTSPASLHGCFNRAPFKPTTELRDHHGTLVSSWPFRMAPDCQYTKSELGQADKLCHGCKWRQDGSVQAAPTDAAAPAAIEVTVTMGEYYEWLGKPDHRGERDLLAYVVERLRAAGIPASVSSASRLQKDLVVANGTLEIKVLPGRDARLFRWVGAKQEPAN